MEIGLLVNNAGKEDNGNFTDIPIEKLEETLDLNCRTPLFLIHHLAKQMIRRKKGGIINMASIVAFQGVPLITNYSATKAYNLIFSEGLEAELRKHDIDVLTVTPGFTNTELSPNYNFKNTPINPLNPEYVVVKAIKALGKKKLVIPGIINSFLHFTGKINLESEFGVGSTFKVLLPILEKQIT